MTDADKFCSLWLRRKTTLFGSFHFAVFSRHRGLKQSRPSLGQTKYNAVKCLEEPTAMISTFLALRFSVQRVQTL